MKALSSILVVVEDDALVRMDIVDSLEDDGFDVFQASNAEEAIQQLVENPSMVAIFTDVDMPGGMDGLRLAAMVRDRWPPIAIIVTSGHRNVDGGHLPAKALFLPKPYRNGEVADSIRALLRP